MIRIGRESQCLPYAGFFLVELKSFFIQWADLVKTVMYNTVIYNSFIYTTLQYSAKQFSEWSLYKQE